MQTVDDTLSRHPTSTPAAVAAHGWSRDLEPDGDGIVRVGALAYGFTPKAVVEARVAIRGLRGRAGVRLVAFDVGRNFLPPRSRLFGALVADLDDIRESMDFCTLALPAGDLRGLALEFSLACSMTTLDRGAGVWLGPEADRDPATMRRLAWALGPLSADLLCGEGIPHGEALELALATVVCDASVRRAAAVEVAARLARRQLPFMALDRSLAIVRRSSGALAAA